MRLSEKDIYNEEQERDAKYKSQNKSPVYCQTTNAHTSKQAVIKQNKTNKNRSYREVADKIKTKREQKEKVRLLLFGLAPPK